MHRIWVNQLQSVRWKRLDSASEQDGHLRRAPALANHSQILHAAISRMCGIC